MPLLLAVFTGLALPRCVPPGLVEARTADPRGNHGSALSVGPYLVRTAPGEMAVVFKAATAQPPVVEWWLPERADDRRVPQGALNRVIAEEHVDQWVAILKQLPLGRLIAYRVRSSVGAAGPFTFKAGVHRGTRFRFAAFGDTRTGHSVHRAVIDAVAKERVDFLLHTGDMVERGGLESEWDLFFQIERPLLVGTPIFPAIGNHDLSPRDIYGEVFLSDVWADSLGYYYQDWGDLRLLVVDAGIECRQGCTQSYFARRALAEGAARGMLLAISVHYPPYSSGAHGSYLSLRRALDDLIRRYGVELVLAGHDHNYERTKPIHGTYYVVTAAAGAPVRPVHKQPFSAVVRTEAHYTLVDVEPTRMTLRAVNLQGDTFDEVVILPVPPRGAP